jgi:hypothetical protein
MSSTAVIWPRLANRRPRPAGSAAAVDHLDQGTEMARHLTIAQSLGAQSILRLPITLAARIERERQWAPA